jgi:Cu(I)/Ag(I) efflux system membrane fusion protein
MDFFNLSTEPVDADVYYTCPMHPEIKLPQMGDCPICGMSLVEKKAGDEEQSGIVAVTPRQIQLTGVTVSAVQERRLTHEIDTYGKIDYDETRLAVVSAWVGGRIDNLFVDFTGTTVQKGHALVSLYSPQLISTENEYLIALKNLRRAEQSGQRQAIESAKSLVTSTRQRLRRWGLSERQLKQVAETGNVEDHVTIYAPVGGTVIEKKATEGMYVKEGDVLFEIADLSRVWLYAEIYEEDIPFLYQEREGDYWTCPMHEEVHREGPGSCPKCGMELIRTNDEIDVAITARAFPGETFEGHIAFTDPFLDPATRTVRVRVNIDNPGQMLKPNMFARAELDLPIGNVIAVPEHAVIQSGERKIVLVEEEPGRFRPQPVRLGRMWLDDPDRLRDERATLVFKDEAMRYHEVLAGVSAGDMVVTSGNFLLGSESQLQGALAKMLEEDEVEQKEAPKYQFTDEPRLGDILSAYYAIHDSLAGDTIGGIHTNASKIAETAKSASIAEAAEPLTHAHHKNDIDATRDDFEGLSNALIAYVASHRDQLKEMPLKAYCPMADAFWLQDGGELLNPYYGSKMLYCGRFTPWDEVASE